MLEGLKLKALQQLIENASKEELIWMNGYLSSLIATRNPEDVPLSAAPSYVNRLTIAYGTETGNSKRIATDFAVRAKKKGINTKIVSLDQYRLNDLPKEEYFLTVISTQGEGEPPDAAKKFFDHIHNNGFKLEKLKYSVLALGDTSYPLFCKAGEDVDAQLQRMGGKRLVPIQKCDLDFDAEANEWFETVLKNLGTNGHSTSDITLPTPTKKAVGKKSYLGKVLLNVNLNDRGSNKETYHIEIAADDVEFEPGDSMGVVPENPLEKVEALIALTGVDRNKQMVYRDASYRVFDLLKTKLNISHLTDRVLKRYATLVQQEITETSMDLYDLLKKYPIKEPAQLEEVFSVLNPVAPRLYTIASSPQAQAGEVHIIVAKDVFTVRGETRTGVCSSFLGELKEDTDVNFFVQKNKRFRLPAQNKDIIMIGPGTGIAAFRSFLAERDATGATGRNWLFFGEQHFASDFLYQTEILSWFETGVLTKVEVAFSRDQPEKVYVQHKMLQNGREFWEWIVGGAYLYVCGTKDPMSIDVEKTLLQIIERFGNKTSEEASQYLTQLEEEGRYSKDVY